MPNARQWKRLRGCEMTVQSLERFAYCNAEPANQGKLWGMSPPAAPFFGCDLLMRSASTLKWHFSTLNTAYSR